VLNQRGHTGGRKIDTGGPANTVSSIARLLGGSRSTLYAYVPETHRSAATDA
jgi:hypothetical protein